MVLTCPREAMGREVLQQAEEGKPVRSMRTRVLWCAPLDRTLRCAAPLRSAAILRQAQDAAQDAYSALWALSPS